MQSSCPKLLCEPRLDLDDFSCLPVSRLVLFFHISEEPLNSSWNTVWHCFLGSLLLNALRWIPLSKQSLSFSPHSLPHIFPFTVKVRQSPSLPKLFQLLCSLCRRPGSVWTGGICRPISSGFSGIKKYRLGDQIWFKWRGWLVESGVLQFVPIYRSRRHSSRQDCVLVLYMHLKPH